MVVVGLGVGTGIVVAVVASPDLLLNARPIVQDGHCPGALWELPHPSGQHEPFRQRRLRASAPLPELHGLISCH